MDIHEGLSVYNCKNFRLVVFGYLLFRILFILTTSSSFLCVCKSLQGTSFSSSFERTIFNHFGVVKLVKDCTTFLYDLFGVSTLQQCFYDIYIEGTFTKANNSWIST